jgi:hypothetical protein
MLFIIPFISANLGTFKQNDCVNIRVLSNCSSVDLVEIDDGTNTYIINSAMENLGGQTFNYSFCNTSKLGTYAYSWDEDCVDCSGGLCGNSFEVSSTGEIYDQSNLSIIIAQAIVLGLFLVLGFSFSKEKWKIRGFFFVLSLFVGVILINSIRVLSGSSAIFNTMNDTIFILMIVSVSFMALYLLIFYTIELFTKVKNKREMRWEVSSKPN